MIPTAQDIILHSGLHPKRVHNIYIFGSRIYNTHTGNSDWDIIMVANNSVEAIELKLEKYNIHIYTPDKFKEDLEWHRINNLECIFAPSWAKLQEKIKFDFTLDVKKLRHATSHVSSNSWVKSKKKLEIGDYHTGIKSIFHSLRIPLFSTRLIETGQIDFTSANFIWNKLMRVDSDWCNYSDLPSVASYKNWSWEELDLEFRELKNNILTEFRKVTEK